MNRVDLHYWTEMVETLIDECDPDDLPAVLRRLLASTAAGLRISEGRLAAAETVYRLADAVAVGD